MTDEQRARELAEQIVAAVRSKEFLNRDLREITPLLLPLIRDQGRYLEARGTLQELRARLHAAGRRPEECYEMFLIDGALARHVSPDAAIDKARGET